ncbi:ADP-heptose--LPS heptosyltransferase 2 [Vibrio thalassae]|uniref:lipopolysaccharide heptosyltransferase II n=2 Tax=Vibrio thalassae TaxID=1243014 RepID=A0A240EGL9_9VIBR|nr:ADP-heptose--LPS heptosyltransferase 2 [Vibrio thalassae]
MSQSLYKAIKDKHPTATIDVLAPAWCRPILERMPEINQTIEMPIGHGSFNLKGRWQIGRELKAARYSHAFVLPNSAKSALIPLFARIPNRIGWKGEMRYGLLTDLRPNKRIFQYYVERFVALASSKEAMMDEVSLERCPRPSLTVNSAAQSAALDKFAISHQRLAIGLCPGAEFGPSKRWPEHYYAQVAQHAIEQGKQVLLFGSAKDREVTSQIEALLTEEARKYCTNLAGNTSLIEAIDLLAACDTVVSNDSGLMHVSAAVGCNIIAIYGSSSPDYTPPLSNNVSIVNTDIECRPCFKRVCPLGHMDCLNQLTPDTVIRLIK